MSNPAFDGLLKIGKSKKDPTTDRVNELNQTGVPEPFKVEYYAFVENEDYLERVVHRQFSKKRPNKNREFFKVDCLDAIETIRTLSQPKAAIKYEEVFYVSPEELKRLREEREEQKRLHEIKAKEEAERQAEVARLRELEIAEEQKIENEKQEHLQKEQWQKFENRRAGLITLVVITIGVALLVNGMGFAALGFVFVGLMFALFFR